MEIHWSALQICLPSVLVFREDRGRYGGNYAVVRIAGLATDTANGWPEPYRAAKTYDPDGHLQQAGIPGPYRSGIWCIRATERCN